MQQHFGAKNTLSRGYPTKLKNYGNSRGNYTLTSFRRHSHIIFMVRTDNKTYFFIMFYRVLVLLVMLDFLNDLGDLKPTKHYVNLSIRVKDLNGYKL